MPIIRPEPLDRRWVTWAEFIEAGWLRAYRRNKIPMKELRAFIEVLRDEFEVPYPLAHKRPLVSGKSLVFRAQEAVELSQHFRLIDQDGMLTYPGQSFVDRVQWKGDLAEGWRPVDDPKSTVIVQPDVRFGRPSVGGISTITIYEYAEEGASRDEIVEEFGVTRTDLRWALSFENAQSRERIPRARAGGTRGPGPRPRGSADGARRRARQDHRGPDRHHHRTATLPARA